MEPADIATYVGTGIAIITAAIGIGNTLLQRRKARTPALPADAATEQTTDAAAPDEKQAILVKPRLEAQWCGRMTLIVRNVSESAVVLHGFDECENILEAPEELELAPYQAAQLTLFTAMGLPMPATLGVDTSLGHVFVPVPPHGI